MDRHPKEIWAWKAGGWNTPDDHEAKSGARGGWVCETDLRGGDEVHYTRTDTLPQWHRIDDPGNPPPKDGTAFFAGNAKEVCMVQWDDYEEGGWLISGQNDPINYFDDATHWQPKLAPPKDSA